VGIGRPADLVRAVAQAGRGTGAAVQAAGLRDELRTVADRLDAPLRLAVGGRLKAGKSTLVNALVGRRVAATAVGECTKVVAWFRYGDRDRIEVHGRDGNTWVIYPERDGSLPADVGAPADDIDHVDVSLSVRSRLGRMTLIDTPGLYSLNDQYSAGARRALGMLDDGSRNAVGQADALVYLMPHPGDADRDFLTSFHALYPDSTFSGANAVGVLSRIDLLCRRPGLEDPWPGARRVAERAARKLRTSVRTVIPVAGLLAETALGGVFTERDALALVALGKVADRERWLASVDAFRAVETSGVEPVDHERLLGLLGLYGLAECLRMIDHGARSSRELLTGLRAASGIDQLVALIEGDFGERANLWRAARALDEFERLSYRAGADDADAIAALRSDIETIRLLPAFHAVAEMRVLRELELGSLRLPPDRTQELLQLAQHSDPRARLGVPTDASAGGAREAARTRWVAWRELENDEHTTAPVRAAARVGRRSFELLLDEFSEFAENSGTSGVLAASNEHNPHLEGDAPRRRDHDSGAAR
jgi:hypothetical protein